MIEGRKLLILNIIIENYLYTGEPVGSRTISKYPELNISSATVRNEMADLEDLGYIMQPHTSAGRIPTDKGYRLYVDNILKSKFEELNNREEEFKKREKALNKKTDDLLQKVNKVETLLHNLAIKLADDTNYATMVTASSVKKNCIKFLQLSQIESDRLILVCVLNNNVIKNQIIAVPHDIYVDTNIIFKINMILNTNLTGLCLDSISISQAVNIMKQAGDDSKLAEIVIEALGKTILGDEGLEVYTGGTTNILKYPELSDESSIKGLLTELVEKQEIAEFISNSNIEDNAIQIYIGDENSVSTMKNCSLVTMSVELVDGMKSTVGIIGPKRMDYQKVINNLSEIKKHLDNIFR